MPSVGDFVCLADCPYDDDFHLGGGHKASSLARQCPLDNAYQIGASTAPQYSIGRLDRLPIELLSQIFLEVDIPTLTQFRCVNRRAMEIVESIPEYAAIIKHCPDIIRGIVSLQADGYSCDYLYNTLIVPKCSQCERFGHRLYLITCERSCGSHWAPSPVLVDVIGSTAAVQCGNKTRSEINASRRQAAAELRAAGIPRVLGLPGRYKGRGAGAKRRRYHIFDEPAAIRHLGENVRRQKFLERSNAVYRWPFVAAPWLYDLGRHYNWGYRCRVCRQNRSYEFHRLPKSRYTKAGILDHIASEHGLAGDWSRLPDF